MTFFETFTESVAWASFAFGAFVIGASVMTLVFYVRRKLIWHIALMALSYTKLCVLMILTINYRIFYDGMPRFWGAVVLLSAFIEGVIGLLLIVWRVTSRAKEQTR